MYLSPQRVSFAPSTSPDSPNSQIITDLSVIIDWFACSRILRKQNHVVCTLYCLASFTQHNYFEIYPFFTQINSSLFSVRNVSHGIDMTQFAYSLTCW